ncbi:hypothetical protein SAMN05216269_1094 [Flavobacterium xinjiangense]|uniref:Uncharacterized protein n=1 Tax=Flavobacterium xinjiangense TaxID=178356 RepID=A0A1M7MQ77_9FLAO|nr:hypothetical protein SAMN05216269_1094 [Flavobacterium xinjiangense]
MVFASPVRFARVSESSISLMKKVTKKSSLKIKSLKTTLKFHSVPRAVRPADSTRGALPFYFVVVFLCFLFKGELKVDV